MNTLCNVVSATIAAAAVLGAGTFLTLWARNGFRGLPERSPPVRRAPGSSFPHFDVDVSLPKGTREPRA